MSSCFSAASLLPGCECVGCIAGFAAWKCMAAPSIFRAASLQGRMSSDGRGQQSSRARVQLRHAEASWGVGLALLHPGGFAGPTLAPPLLLLSLPEGFFYAKVSQASAAFSGPRGGTIIKVVLGWSPPDSSQLILR